MSKVKIPFRPGTVVAVEFDGVCVSNEYPRMGFDTGAAPVLRRIVACGGHIVLWTVRSGKELLAAVGWFEAKGIPLFGINANPVQNEWMASPKCQAQIYIDAAALGCPLLDGAPGDRKFVDWATVSKILWPEPKKIRKTHEKVEKS